MEEVRSRCGNCGKALAIAYLIIYAVVITYLFPIFSALITQVKRLLRIRTPEKQLRRYKVTQFNNWAVITGASSGIGEFIARRLFSCGFSVLLIARKEDLLKDICDDLNSKKKDCSNNRAEYEVCDVLNSDTLAKTLDKISMKFEQDPKSKLRILVNNVGTVQKCFNYFQDMKIDEVTSIIDTNITANSYVMYRLLPLIKKEKNGLVINLGSSMGKFATPLISVYAASKAYINSISNSLKIELGDSNIDVICACPWYVSTNMTMTKKTTLTFISPKYFTELLLSEKLHNRSGDSLVDPYFVHAMMDFLFGRIIVSFYIKGQLFLSNLLVKKGKIERKLQRQEASKIK